MKKLSGYEDMQPDSFWGYKSVHGKIPGCIIF